MIKLWPGASKILRSIAGITFFSSFLFFFFYFSFRLVFILGITVLLCFYIQFLDLQIFFSALLAVPPKYFARSCNLRISSILLADVSENFRKTCVQYYKLDPCHYFTSPELHHGMLC